MICRWPEALFSAGGSWSHNCGHMRAACSIKLALAIEKVVFCAELVRVASCIASGTVVSLIAQFLDQRLLELGIAGKRWME